MDKLCHNKKIQANINIAACAVLILFALLSTAKLIILGLTIDEEYAVAMSYRNAIGDRMFIDMWEPHQTSGFLCTVLIKLFMAVTGGTDHLVIFLRFSGFIIECLVALFVYSTLRKDHSRHLSFCLSLLAFLVLPKQMLVPDFSNILMWSGICLLMSLQHIAAGSAHTIRWSIISGMFVCVCVLAYPSLVIAALILTACIYSLSPDKKTKNALIYLGTCAVIGIVYVGYFLTHMSVSELLFGIRQMLSDGSHADSALKYGWIIKEFRSWIIPLLIINAVSILICLIIRKKAKGITTYLSVLTIVSLIHQIIFWCMDSNPYINEPLLFYYIAFIACVITNRKEKKTTWSAILPSILIWIGVILVTNTGFRVAGTFLLIGMLPLLIGLFKGEQSEKTHPIFGQVIVFLMIFALMFERGYLVIENEGFKENAFFVKQKALSGPCLNVYCRYNDGYDYNTVAGLLGSYSEAGDVLLVLEAHNLWYMLSDARIATYSTISTPTFDERLPEYWSIHPERFPTVVITRAETALPESVFPEQVHIELLDVRDGIAIYRIER